MSHNFVQFRKRVFPLNLVLLWLIFTLILIFLVACSLITVNTQSAEPVVSVFVNGVNSSACFPYG